MAKRLPWSKLESDYVKHFSSCGCGEVTLIVLAKLTSVCYITRYANGKNKTTNRELRQIPAGIRTCCHTQKGLRRLLTFSMASTISNGGLFMIKEILGLVTAESSMQ